MLSGSACAKAAVSHSAVGEPRGAAAHPTVCDARCVLDDISHGTHGGGPAPAHPLLLSDSAPSRSLRRSMHDPRAIDIAKNHVLAGQALRCRDVCCRDWRRAGEEGKWAAAARRSLAQRGQRTTSSGPPSIGTGGYGRQGLNSSSLARERSRQLPCANSRKRIRSMAAVRGGYSSPAYSQRAGAGRHRAGHSKR